MMVKLISWIHFKMNIIKRKMNTDIYDLNQFFENARNGFIEINELNIMDILLDIKSYNRNMLVDGLEYHIEKYSLGVNLTITLIDFYNCGRQMHIIIEKDEIGKYLKFNYKLDLVYNSIRYNNSSDEEIETLNLVKQIYTEELTLNYIEIKAKNHIINQRYITKLSIFYFCGGKYAIDFHIFPDNIDIDINNLKPSESDVVIKICNNDFLDYLNKDIIKVDVDNKTLIINDIIKLNRFYGGIQHSEINKSLSEYYLSLVDPVKYLLSHYKILLTFTFLNGKSIKCYISKISLIKSLCGNLDHILNLSYQDFRYKFIFDITTNESLDEIKKKYSKFGNSCKIVSKTSGKYTISINNNSSAVNNAGIQYLFHDNQSINIVLMEDFVEDDRFVFN